MWIGNVLKQLSNYCELTHSEMKIYFGKCYLSTVSDEKTRWLYNSNYKTNGRRKIKVRKRFKKYEMQI